MITKVCQFQANPGERLVEVFTPGEMEKAASFFNMGKTAAPLLAPVQQYLEKLQADPNKIYVLVNALGAGEYWGSNINGDYFPEGSLVHKGMDWGYETFYNAYPYKHHVNKDPSRSFGKVELAVWHDGMKRVELVIAIDRARAKMFGAEDICDKLDQGMFPDVSMGCKVPYDLCSKCLDWEKYRRAQSTYDPLIHRTVGQAVLAYHRKDPIRGLSVTRNDYCEHLKTMLNKILPDGTKIYAINDYPRFFDISFVFIGADKTAKVMAKLAEAHSCFNGVCVPSWLVAEQQYGVLTDKGFEKTASFSPAGHGLANLESILSDIGVERSAASDIGRVLSSPIESIRSKLREKKASHDKWAEIIKNVAPSQFGNKAIRLDRQGSDLPDNVLDSLGEHGDLSQALSTPTSMGIVLRPREFQRITLISIGRKPMADSMDSAGSVFRPCDEEDSSVPMGPGHFSSILKRILLPLMEDRSFLEPVARRRVVRISIHPGPHHGMGMGRMMHFAEPNPLLTKISAAYNSYLDRIGNCMGHAEEIVNEHPDVWEAAFRSGVEEGFSKEASGMKPGSLPIVLGSIAGAALLSNYADYQRQRAMQGDREPVSALTALAADNPRTMMLLAGMGAMHLRGSNIPRRIVGTAAGALKGFLGAKPR